MTREEERRYVRRWAETGHLLEEIRWRELQSLDPVVALRASDDLLNLALRVHIPDHRRGSSGLLTLQDILHGRRR